MAGPRNLDEKGISLVGRPLYDAFIRGYTAKQWQTDPEELPAEVISRLPMRFTYDNRYFDDTIKDCRSTVTLLGSNGWPTTPTSRWSSGCDFFDPASRYPKAAVVGRVPVVYTGPIDRYFDFEFGDLGWRTLDMEPECCRSATSRAPR